MRFSSLFAGFVVCSVLAFPTSASDNPFMITPIKTQSIAPSIAPVPKKIPQDFEKMFTKGQKRAEVLVRKNNLLKTPVDIEATRSCLQNTLPQDFEAMGETPKKAFQKWMKTCQFASTSGKVTQQQTMEKLHTLRATTHSYAHIKTPQNVIDSILDTNKWDASTKTLLGNNHPIYHSLESEQSVVLESLGIHELIGVGLSSFGGSSAERKQNFINAANKFDGKIIHPGESISALKTLAPFSAKNGYTEGKVIIEGETQDEMGGGVCQSVTTMFRVWNNAGLEVVKAKPHSKSIGYYGGIGLDATMYQGPSEASSVDLVLKNDSNTSVMIQTAHFGKYQIFLLYGSKDRTVSLDRTSFEQSKTAQKAVWKRIVTMMNGGETVEKSFVQRQGRE